MSTAIAYDPALFSVERASAISSGLGSFILGVSKLGGAATSGWVNVPAATATLGWNYSPDENGTLIVDPDTCEVSISFWDEPGDILFPGDRVRVVYDGKGLFTGTVERTALTYVVDPAAVKHGATRRVDFSATCAGRYAVMMGKEVCWDALPQELWIDRISRFVTVYGWE